MIKTSQFLRFGLVGVLGFIIDSAALTFCMWALGMGPYAGRVVSFLAAVTVTWACNRTYTFRERTRTDRLPIEWTKFLIVCLGGFVFNYGSYALLIAHSTFIATFPILGIAVGSVTGMFFNYLASKRLVFK